MKRFKKVFASFISLILLCSCSNTQQYINSVESGVDSSEENQVIEQSPFIDEEIVYINSTEEFSNKTQITIVIDYNYRIDEQIVDEFNKKLDKDGYSFALNLVQVNMFKMAAIDYYEQSLSENKPVDILLTGCGISQEIIDSDRYTFSCKAHTNTYWECVDKGYLISLNKYLKSENDNNLYEIFPEKYWWSSTDDKGEIYGLYVAYDMDLPVTLNFNDNLANKYSFDYNTFNGDIASLENVLKKIKDGSNSSGLVMEESSNIDNGCFAILDFSMSHKGAFVNENTQLFENIFENERFTEFAEVLSDYRKEGYLLDINSVSETNETLCQLTTFSSLSEPNGEQIIIADNYQSYANLSGGVGITSTSNYPDEAFELLTLLFADKEYAQILAFGVEGRNYTINDQNEMQFDSDYPSLYAYHIFGNIPLNPYIIENSIGIGGGADNENKKELLDKQFEHIKKSCVYGIRLDYSQIEDKLDKVYRVYNQYCGLFCGKYDDVDATLKEANKKLKEAGIDDVIEELNKQLEVYYEKNN